MQTDLKVVVWIMAIMLVVLTVIEAIVPRPAAQCHAWVCSTNTPCVCVGLEDK